MPTTARGRRAAARNAVARTVVDYGGDPLGEAVVHAFGGMGLRGLRGEIGTVYAGADDDPSSTFQGQAPLAVQTFTGAAFLAHNGSRFREQNATIETGLTDGPYADPARRIFADRLRRRR